MGANKEPMTTNSTSFGLKCLMAANRSPSPFRCPIEPTNNILRGLLTSLLNLFSVKKLGDGEPKGDIVKFLSLAHKGIESETNFPGQITASANSISFVFLSNFSSESRIPPPKVIAQAGKRSASFKRSCLLVSQ